jgi:hypothetical protein
MKAIKLALEIPDNFEQRVFSYCYLLRFYRADGTAGLSLGVGMKWLITYWTMR